MQVLGGDPLIQAILSIDRFKLDHFSPFFACLLFLSQGFERFGVLGVMDDSARVEFNRLLEMSDGSLS